MDENLKLAVYRKFREIGIKHAMAKLADITDTVSSGLSAAKDTKSQYDNAPSIAKDAIGGVANAVKDSIDLSPQQKQVVDKVQDRITSRHPIIDTIMQDGLGIKPEPESISGAPGMAFDAVDRFGSKVPVMGEPLSGMAYFTKNYATPTARKIDQQINPFENPQQFEYQMVRSKNNNLDREEISDAVSQMEAHSKRRSDEVDDYRAQAVEQGQSGQQAVDTARRMQRINDEREEDDRLYKQLGQQGYKAEMERRNNLANSRYQGPVQTDPSLQRQAVAVPKPAAPAPRPAAPAPRPAAPAPRPAVPAPRPVAARTQFTGKPNFRGLNKHQINFYKTYQRGNVAQEYIDKNKNFQDIIRRVETPYTR
jgi:hypothetical protein